MLHWLLMVGYRHGLTQWMRIGIRNTLQLFNNFFNSHHHIITLNIICISKNLFKYKLSSQHFIHIILCQINCIPSHTFFLLFPSFSQLSSLLSTQHYFDTAAQISPLFYIEMLNTF